MAKAGKNLTQVAADAGIAKATLSGLVHDDHGASKELAGKVAEGAEAPAAMLFPGLLLDEIRAAELEGSAP